MALQAMDAGKTWTHMGLDRPPHRPHPRPPDQSRRPFACAIGRITRRSRSAASPDPEAASNLEPALVLFS